MVISSFDVRNTRTAALIEAAAVVLKGDVRRRAAVLAVPQPITASLAEAAALAEEGRDISAALEPVIAELSEAAALLGSDTAATALELRQLEELLQERAGYAAALARCSRTAARMLAEKTGWNLLEAGDFFLLNLDGTVNETTYEKMQKAIVSNSPCIIPGSYGQTTFGRITLPSGRGPGLTAAAAAAAVGAGLLELWSDAGRVLMADPSIVEDPQPVTEITYQEMRELSSVGTGMLLDGAVFILHGTGIPIEIRDFRSPEEPGTRIVSDRDDRKHPVIAVHGSPGFCRLYVEKLMLSRDPDYKLKIRTILKVHGIDPEFSSIGYDSLSFYFQQKRLRVHTEIIARIVQELSPDEICTDERLAMIGIVGKGLYDRSGVLARVSTALSDVEISIRYLNYGGSLMTCIVGVDEDSFERAIQVIYAALKA